jgi:hypothetical protein
MNRILIVLKNFAKIVKMKKQAVKQHLKYKYKYLSMQIGK